MKCGKIYGTDKMTVAVDNLHIKMINGLRSNICFDQISEEQIKMKKKKSNI